MAGTQKKKKRISKNMVSASAMQSKSLKTAALSTLTKTSPKTTRKKDIAALDSPKKKNSSSSSSKNLTKDKKINSHGSSMPNSLKETISNILETRTKEANLKHSLNLQRARNLVAGEKRSVGRPKKEPLEKEKPRTIRASDKFILLAKEFSKRAGYNGQWQTWLKALALRQFEDDTQKR